jgi:hypothetical protein
MNVKFYGIELWKESRFLVLKGFGVIYVKFVVGKWCNILVIHRQYKGEKIFMQTRM